MGEPGARVTGLPARVITVSEDPSGTLEGLIPRVKLLPPTTGIEPEGARET